MLLTVYLYFIFIKCTWNQNTSTVTSRYTGQQLNRNETIKNLEYYMEDEDQIYYHPWRADTLEIDREVLAEVPPLPEEEIEKFIRYDADGRRIPTDEVMGHFSRLNNSYLVLAPLLARPSSVYRVVVVPYKVEDRSQDIDLRATISTSTGSELTFAVGKASLGISSELMLKLPDALPGPYLRMRVEGRQGSNVLFVNSTLVHPSNDFLIILVFMARPAFTGDQLVEFRVALLTIDMLPYQEPVDIFILDPTGYIVRRWVSRVPNTGFVDLKFLTPMLPASGFWRVRVKAKNQIKEHPFLVTTYFVPRFEIMFDVPPFFLASDEAITGEIAAYVTNDANVYGNMTVILWIKYPATADDSEYKQVGDPEVFEYIAGAEEFEFPMEMFQSYIPQLVGSEVKIVAEVTDSFTGMTQSGFVKTRIIAGEVSVNFVGPDPVIFRPGMPLTLSVNVAYDDNESLDPEDLTQSALRITASVTRSTGGSVNLPQIFIPAEMEEGSESEVYLRLKEAYDANITNSHDGEEEISFRTLQFESLLAKEAYILRSKFDEYRNSGIFTFTLQIPRDSVTLTVNAVFTDSEGTTSGAKLDGHTNYHPKDKQLHVTTSSDTGVVGEYVIFHVRTNFPLQRFYYIIMSKAIVLHSSTEDVPFAGAEGVATLGIAVSKSMYPTMTFIAYYVDTKGDVVADTIVIPVEIPSNILPVEIILNQHKDHTKRTVEAFAAAPAGTYFSVSCARQVSYAMQPRNRITPARLSMTALSLETFQRTIARVHRQPRNSADPATVRFLISGDTEGDTLRTLQSSGLASLSDTRFDPVSTSLGRCEISLGLLECGDGTCYKYSDVCNGVKDCADGRDELLCQYEFHPTISHQEGLDEFELYLLFRSSWWNDLFDSEDGSWAWKATFIGHGEDEELGLVVPRTQDDWTLDGFAMNTEIGFSFAESVSYNSDPPLFIVLEGPTVCRRGEQIAIRTAVFNSMPYTMIVLVILPHSDDYQFIHVEDKGVVDVYKPRTSSGEHHHLLFIPPGETKEMFWPIAVLRQIGTLEVTVRMSSQLAWDEESIEIEIKPEGAPVRKHTSVLLDLKSRALFYEFMDLPIDEIPIISNTIFRRFIFGSPQASLTISGDVFGPTSEEISISFDNAFNGRWFKSTDGLAFNFGATLWTLHYLRLTNQLILSESLKAFEFLNVQLAGIMTRFRDGGFKMWHYSGPSVWLTAHISSLFSAAMLEDWENLIYIDPRILRDAAQFMLQHQSPQGDFYETEFCNITLDHKYNYKKSFDRNVSVGITAYITATLQEILPALPGSTRALTSQAIWRARRFLERSFSSLKNPYDVAITAWALSVVGSAEKDIAVSKLLKIMRAQDGFLYWAKERVNSNDRIFENNQRTFLLPKEPQEWDSDAIEATSYALLVLLNREGVTLRQERIVSWLVSVRDWDYAFAATSDSLVALRALTEYCYRARLRDVTDLTVEVEASSTLDFNEYIRVEQPFVSVIQSLEIPNPWGHILMTGRGAGQAIAQLTTTWGVDVPFYLERPPREYFTLEVREFHHLPRNKSRITTTVCTQWTATDVAPTSHAAMIEIEVPSGYFMHQHEVNKMVKATKRTTFPEIADALITDSYIFFQFNYIPPQEQCFSYEIHRWHPVANLTFIRSAMVFELYSPEHFEQIIINSTTLSALDICEVCGSFQCPYCHFYSATSSLQVSFALIFSLMILIHAIASIAWSGRIFIMAVLWHDT